MQLVAGTAIVSGILVLLGWFTLPVRIAMLVALAILAWRSRQPTADSRKPGDVARRSAWGLKLLACSSAALAAALLLWHSGTTDPIRSPWSVVPVPFFFLYAMIGVFSAKGAAPVLWRGCASGASISITLALSSLVAILVYPLGFGFDHFIHAAAERIIATTGALSPPPLFYSGHYGLTVFLADLLPGVGVDLADRILTPLLTVTFLVPLAYRSLRSVLPDRVARLGLSSLLIVPFLPLAVSTPQATANVFALATVLLLMERSQSIFSPPPIGRGSARGWGASFATALAALLSQPMTGIITIAIVAIAFVRGLLTKKTRSRFFGQWLSGVLTAVITIGGAIAIPLAFTVAGRIIPNLDLNVTFNPLPALQRLVLALRDALEFTTVDFATADALAVARVLLPLAWVGLATIGIRTLWRGPSPTHSPSQWEGEKERESNRGSALTLIIAPVIALAAAALVAATVTIPTQLGEEQSQFPLRLVQLAALLATPLAAIGLGTLLSRIFSPSFGRGSERGWQVLRSPQLAVMFILGAIATFDLLLAYPRDDAQTRSGLWSVSADDIAAVHAIANDAGDVPYVVLANQMLGAAAIREFGFRPTHRINNFSPSQGEGEREGVGTSEILAFPLPAGGPIARKYWEFVSQEIQACSPPSPHWGEGGRGGERWCADRTPIDAAMGMAGATRAYVVLHDYWRNYERLTVATDAIADAEVGQFSHLRIFRLTR